MKEHGNAIVERIDLKENVKKPVINKVVVYDSSKQEAVIEGKSTSNLGVNITIALAIVLSLFLVYTFIKKRKKEKTYNRGNKKI